MQTNDDKSLEIVLIADDAYRIAMLRKMLLRTGLQCSIRRVPVTAKSLAYLARKNPGGKARPAALVLFDFGEADVRAVDFARRLAFGPRRSRVPVVLLTSVSSEAVLERGEIDGGKATMFSPRPLASVLQKLADRRQAEFLQALAVLYQYGPILVRQPRQLLESKKNLMQRSA